MAMFFFFFFFHYPPCHHWALQASLKRKNNKQTNKTRQGILQWTWA
jgi:hypothetical protein